MGNSWKAKGVEVQEAGRLAPDYEGLVVMERISKLPEGQRQGHCDPLSGRNRSSVIQAYHHQSLDLHAIKNSSSSC